MVTRTFPRPASRRRIPHALGVVALLVLAGCGDGPKVARVTGKVFYRDKPLQGATIWFRPDPTPGSNGKAAEAMVGPDGSFSLVTDNVGGGVIPGRYKVGVWVGKTKDPALSKYTNAKTTPLTVDVPPDGLTDYEVRLK